MKIWEEIYMKEIAVALVGISGTVLTLVYNKRDLRNIFFDNNFDSEIIVRYLK